MDTVAGLRLFIRVVETGSFSKASADMGLTQPTATKHVAALEARLGARLFHRSTRGVTPTEVGLLYYDRCKLIVHELDEADNLATLTQQGLSGRLRVNTSVAFGRRVLTPLILRFMHEHPGLQVDLAFDDRYVNLVEQGIDVAIRMGRLADSQLGARWLGVNPWVVVGAPDYLRQRGEPLAPADLGGHDVLVYSSVQDDDRWPLSGPEGQAVSVPVRGPLRSNNLSALLSAARAGMGLAALPRYVAHASLAAGALRPVLPGWAPAPQEVHAVFTSPRRLPGKVRTFVDWLAPRLADGWWEGWSQGQPGGVSSPPA